MFKEQQTCGSWESSITAEMVAGAAVRYADVQLDGDAVIWLEGRPHEQGRNVIVRRLNGKSQDLLPAPYNARSRVHEYGGGAYVAFAGDIWFINDSDQQAYHLQDGQISQLTDQPACRFADLQYDMHHECLYAIREDHRNKGLKEPVNELVKIQGGKVSVVASGDDFYASPALSHDGHWLAWLSWTHPDMPWDATTLWLARIDVDGNIGSPKQVLANAGQSVFRPSWSADGRLYFVTDPDDWWMLYRLNDCADLQSIELVCDMQAEIGKPLWQFGMRCYAFRNDNQIIASLCEQGLWRLVKICTNTGEVEPVASPYNSFGSLAANEHLVAMIAAGSEQSDEIATVDLDNGQLDMCLEHHSLPVDSSWISVAQPVSFETSDDEIAHGFYYPPKNPCVVAKDDELPPLLVMTHGGPTGATSASFNLRNQFWTSRGFAVLDVNYRGSTGYGSAYREKLKGKWGVYDVEDVVAGANYLVQQGKVDEQRLAIRGGSAGGYTTLAALTFTEVFAAGASYYGIGDLKSLAEDTHKFEARYLDRLVGEYPKDSEIYASRSPLNHVEQLSCPVIFMQGEEDQVVPPQQARCMAAALEKKGVTVELRLFAGEQDGFRRAETIIETLNAELAFYGHVFNFDTSGP